MNGLKRSCCTVAIIFSKICRRHFTKFISLSLYLLYVTQDSEDEEIVISSSDTEGHILDLDKVGENSVSKRNEYSFFYVLR